jgi:hypothetical protein
VLLLSWLRLLIIPSMHMHIPSDVPVVLYVFFTNSPDDDLGNVETCSTPPVYNI